MPRSRARPDHYSREAKKRSYPARSVFKLEELDRRFGILRAGQRVLDLGCAPGSWLLYAAERVGKGGLVVGVDLHGLRSSLPPNARYLRHDVHELRRDDLGSEGRAPFDVVLSDMAPHTSGNRLVDQQRSLRLLLRALEVAAEACARGGAFVGKVFQSEDVNDARDRASEIFEQVKLVRPKAVRKESTELYVVGLRRKPLGLDEDSWESSAPR